MPTPESLFHKQIILCPRCGSEENATIWDIVNVQSDPDLKDRLLRKALQSTSAPTAARHSSSPNDGVSRSRPQAPDPVLPVATPEDGQNEAFAARSARGGSHGTWPRSDTNRTLRRDIPCGWSPTTTI